MNKMLAFLALAAGVAVAPVHADDGAILGGVVGSAVGAAIGQNMNGYRGAVVGAAIGGATGAAIGGQQRPVREVVQPRRVMVPPPVYAQPVYAQPVYPQPVYIQQVRYVQPYGYYPGDRDGYREHEWREHRRWEERGGWGGGWGDHDRGRHEGWGHRFHDDD